MALDHLANCKRGQWHAFVDTAVEKGHLKRVDGASVTVMLLDAQRFGEFDTAETRPETPDRSMLPPAQYESYLAPAPTSEPLASLLGADENRSDFQAKANRTFRTALGL